MSQHKPFKTRDASAWAASALIALSTLCSTVHAGETDARPDCLNDTIVQKVRAAFANAAAKSEHAMANQISQLKTTTTSPALAAKHETQLSELSRCLKEQDAKLIEALKHPRELPAGQAWTRILQIAPCTDGPAPNQLRARLKTPQTVSDFSVSILESARDLAVICHDNAIVISASRHEQLLSENQKALERKLRELQGAAFKYRELTAARAAGVGCEWQSADPGLPADAPFVTGAIPESAR